MASDIQATTGNSLGLVPRDVSGFSTTSVIVSAVFMLTLVPICVALRLWSQRLLHDTFDASCWCLMVASFVAVVDIVGTLALIPLGLEDAYGRGQHGVSMFMNPPDFLKLAFADTILSYPSLALSKVAVLLHYRRMFPTPWVRRTTTVIGLFITIWASTSIFVSAFACHPIEAIWNAVALMQSGQGSANFTCMAVQSWFAYSTIPSIMADIVMLSVPIREVSRLQMSCKTKLAVCAIFLLGGIVTVIGIVRVALIIMSDSMVVAAAPWLVAEQGLSVICAGLLGIGPAVKRTKQVFVSLKDASRSRTQDVSHVDFVYSKAQHGSLSEKSSWTRQPRNSSDTESPAPHKSAPPSLLKSPFLAFKNAIAWSSMPPTRSAVIGNSRSHPELDHPPFDRDFHLPAAHDRTAAEMDVYRRVYQYSGQSPFSQNAYASMTDSQLYGGIRVERTVDLTVEEAAHGNDGGTSADTQPADLRVFDGRGSGSEAVYKGEVTSNRTSREGT